MKRVSSLAAVAVLSSPTPQTAAPVTVPQSPDGAVGVLLDSVLDLGAGMAAFGKRIPVYTATATATATTATGSTTSTSAAAIAATGESEGSSSSSASSAVVSSRERLSWSKAWLQLLCYVILVVEPRGARHTAKRLLRRLCRSQTKYHGVRDGYLFAAETRKVSCITTCVFAAWIMCCSTPSALGYCYNSVS
jgi:hypothetical protein